MNYEQFGKIAYEIYIMKSGNSFSPWEELSNTYKECWIEVSKAVLDHRQLVLEVLK